MKRYQGKLLEQNLHPCVESTGFSKKAMIHGILHTLWRAGYFIMRQDSFTCLRNRLFLFQLIIAGNF